MRFALPQVARPLLVGRQRQTVSVFPSNQESLLREAHNTAWPEVNLDALEVTKVGRRVRQHVNPFKEELQVPIQPPDWTKTFQTPTLPLTVDIGCGPGRFLLASAKRAQGRNYLGLEIRQPLVDRANDWSRAMGLTGQVRFVYASANVQLGNLLQTYPGEVDLVTVQFPDPHWKAKHKKRRIVQPALVQTIRDILRPGGREKSVSGRLGFTCASFAEDEIDLQVAQAMWDEVVNAAGGSFHLAEGNQPSAPAATMPAVAGPTWLQSNPLGTPSEREVVSKELGLPVYRVLFVKK